MNHQTEARDALAAPIGSIGLICVTFVLVCGLVILFSQGLFNAPYSTTIKGYPPQFTFYKQRVFAPGVPFSVFSISERNVRGDFVQKDWAIYPKHMEEAPLPLGVLEYGKVPAGWTEKMPAKPLRANTYYLVNGGDFYFLQADSGEWIVLSPEDYRKKTAGN